MPYEVINLDTDEAVGVFTNLVDAQRFARKLDTYEIWQGYQTRGIYGEAPEWVAEQRVEFCDGYDSDDERVREGLGLPPRYHDDTPSLPGIPAR